MLTIIGGLFLIVGSFFYSYPWIFVLFIIITVALFIVSITGETNNKNSKQINNEQSNSKRNSDCSMEDYFLYQELKRRNKW